MSSVSPVVQDVATATDNLAKASYQAANKAGAIDSYLENFYAHLVRKPAGGSAGMSSFTPSELSSFTKFALSRGRDAAGNVLLPTLDDFAAFVAKEHPDWQVITDPATVAEAHLVGLGKAANHGAVMDFFKGIADPSTGQSVLLTDTQRARLAAQDPRAAAYLQQGYRQVDLPSSMSRFVYRGQAPESGAIALSRRGVAGTAGSQAVVEQQPLVWARSDVADLLDRYTQQDPPWTHSPVMNAYKAADALVVGDKMMNPVIHPLNVVSDVLSSLPRAAIKGSLPGWVEDWGKAHAIQSDPVKLATFLQQHDAVLPVIERYARDLAERTGPLQDSTPFLTGAQNVLNASAGKVRALNHRVVFEGAVQPAIIHDILQAERQGRDAASASAIASIKYAGIRPSELQGFQKWVTGLGTFAPSWTNGTIAEIGSTVAGRRGLTAGGYGYKLTAAQQTSVANALRADYLSGQAMNFALTSALNHQLSGHWPWQNEAGRWLDIDTGQKDASGKTVYITNPLFRRQADLLRLAAVPGTPLSAGEGTNT
ncbi:MAG: hypothetical protein ACHQ7M_16860, partial [Chloroflexota bacterium]